MNNEQKNNNIPQRHNMTDQDVKSGGFHMEPLTLDAHSMTPEEAAADLKRKGELAKEGIRKAQKALIIGNLKARGIDPSTIDIDELIRQNSKDNDKNSSEINESMEVAPKKEEMKDMIKTVKYLQLVGGKVIKIDDGKLYVFDGQTRTWRESPRMFAEYEQGNIFGTEVRVNDTFPIGEPLAHRRSL